MAKKKTMTAGYVLVKKDHYRIREKADTNSAALGTAVKGEKIAYLGKTDKGWYKVSKDGMTGWLYKQAGELTVVELKYLTLKKGNWNVRSAPDAKSASLGKVKGGEKILDQGQSLNGYRLVEFEKQNAWLPAKAFEKE